MEERAMLAGGLGAFWPSPVLLDPRGGKPAFPLGIFIVPFDEPLIGGEMRFARGPAEYGESSPLLFWYLLMPDQSLWPPTEIGDKGPVAGPRFIVYSGVANACLDLCAGYVQLCFRLLYRIMYWSIIFRKVLNRGRWCGLVVVISRSR
jgi:hypothetical protein